MCGRYILVQKREVLEKRFNVSFEDIDAYQPSYNISTGNFAAVITNDKPSVIQLYRFGLSPFWAKKSMYLINARTEGDNNKDNNPEYRGAKGIITKPAFRKPIRSQRCLVLADAFIEGTTKEKLSRPYLVYLKEKVRPFAFAGIWDAWQNPQTDEVINTFAIITTVANTLLQKIPHNRSPVIIPQRYEKRWLNSNLPLADVVKLLKPYHSEFMNAYPIRSDIKIPDIEGKQLIQPIGQRLEKEYETKINSSWELQGMGSNTD